MYFLPAERLRLYRNFKAIETNDFHGITRFYEQNEDGIRALDFDEYLDCTLIYTNALFETAEHGKHLVMCDHLLELVIIQNVETWGGEDLYHQLLFKKAASLFHLQDYKSAERILREIIKIYPGDGLAQLYLNKSLLRQRPDWLFQLRKTGVVFALSAAAMIAVELFVAPRFFPEWVQALRLTRTTLIGLSLAALSLGEAGHALRAWFGTQRFVKRALQNKRSKQR